MSRRRSRGEPAQDVTVHMGVHDGMDRLSILTTRANLMWLATRQRDVAAREASSGRALTGMPVHRSTEPRLPGVLAGPDLSGDIARALDMLVKELVSIDHEYQPDPRETVRWYQAAQGVEKACPDEHDALSWWDTASALRARAERVLGPSAAGRFMGACPVPDCPGEVRMADDQHAALCGECGAFITREQQVEYVVEEFQTRLMTGSEIASALELARVPVPYSTLRRWIATGRLPEADPGLYRFKDAFDMAGRRHGIKAA